MEIVSFSLGRLQANCYLLIKGRDCLIIDPGDEGGFLLEKIQNRGLKIRGLLATHGHFDHIMAAGEIERSFSVPFYISSQDLFLVKRMRETAEHFLGYKPWILEPSNMQFLSPGEIKISRWSLKVIDTPGHTPGSCSFLFNQALFTGDTLFKGNIGRYDFSYSSFFDLRQSVKKLLNLNGKITVYPGHGERTTIENERGILERFRF